MIHDFKHRRMKGRKCIWASLQKAPPITLRFPSARSLNHAFMATSSLGRTIKKFNQIESSHLQFKTPTKAFKNLQLSQSTSLKIHNKSMINSRATSSSQTVTSKTSSMWRAIIWIRGSPSWRRKTIGRKRQGWLLNLWRISTDSVLKLPSIVAKMAWSNSIRTTAFRLSYARKLSKISPLSCKR